MIMDKYKVKSTDSLYYVEAENKNEARKLVLEREGIKIEKVEEDITDTKGKLIYLEQDDPRWKNETIGNTKVTLGAKGCLITDLSMASYWAGNFFTPAEIAKKAKFTSNALYIWKSGDDFLPFKFVYRYYYRDINKIADIIHSEKGICVVEVKNGAHWLFAISYNNRLLAIDPINAGIVDVEATYGKVTGFAELTLKQ